MRSPSLVRHISGLTAADFKTITLDRPGPYNKPKVAEFRGRGELTSYPGTVGRSSSRRARPFAAATVIISNDHDLTDGQH